VRIEEVPAGEEEAHPHPMGWLSWEVSARETIADLLDHVAPLASDSAARRVAAQGQTFEERDVIELDREGKLAPDATPPVQH